MSCRIHDIDGVRVVEAGAEGAIVRGESDANELISQAWENKAEWLAAPVERLSDDFFHLETRVAGDVIQKFVTNGVRLAVFGDISTHLARSKALRDFVYESNRGVHVWFVEDMGALERMLDARRRGA